DPEAVRNVHVAPERKDSQGRVSAEESDRGRRDRAVAARDQHHTKAIDQRALREVGRGRALCTGLATIDIEARGGEQADAVREVAVLGVPLAGCGVDDQDGAFACAHRRASWHATGLGPAFFRWYVLESLVSGPARPAALLAAIAAERLPFASGAFGRALQSLIEGGYLAPASAATVCLTALGAAERTAERERWSTMLPTLVRLLGNTEPRPFPIVAEMPPPRERPVAEAYLDRVLVASVRERIAAARDGGPAFAVVLAQVDVDAVGEATRRAMVHRAIRATLGATATLFGGDVSAYRYGECGVAAIAPVGRDTDRGERLAALVRSRLDELMRTMTSTVRAFGDARGHARAGAAAWSEEVATTPVLLRRAGEALSMDGDRRDAA